MQDDEVRRRRGIIKIVAGLSILALILVATCVVLPGYPGYG
jgi:hypothetical protein